MPLDVAGGDGFGDLPSPGDIERGLAGRARERVVKVDSVYRSKTRHVLPDLRVRGVGYAAR